MKTARKLNALVAASLLLSVAMPTAARAQDSAPQVDQSVQTVETAQPAASPVSFQEIQMRTMSRDDIGKNFPFLQREITLTNPYDPEDIMFPEVASVASYTDTTNKMSLMVVFFDRTPWSKLPDGTWPGTIYFDDASGKGFQSGAAVMVKTPLYLIKEKDAVSIAGCNAKGDYEAWTLPFNRTVRELVYNRDYKGANLPACKIKPAVAPPKSP